MHPLWQAFFLLYARPLFITYTTYTQFLPNLYNISTVNDFLLHYNIVINNFKIIQDYQSCTNNSHGSRQHY